MSVKIEYPPHQESDDLVLYTKWGNKKQSSRQIKPEPKEFIGATSEIEHCEVHSDAGGHGSKMECPNCLQSVVFAPGQWWRSECQCGEWDLIVEARLITEDDDNEQTN